MNICRFAVTRPVAVTVLMMVLVLFGLLSLHRLPVREYPNIELPTITISTTYVGASSSIVETKVTQILENAVSGIEGLDNMRSTSKEGKSSITLEFNVSRDLDGAANDVRDCIGRVQKSLPPEVDTPVIKKYDTDTMPIILIAIVNPNMTSIELTDYAQRYLIDRFSVLDGVANVSLIGAYEESMRIWLNRDEMAARGVTVSDIQKALMAENIEYPAGRIESSTLEYPITIERQFCNPSDFAKLIIRLDENGTPIRMEDIARVEIGAKSQRSLFRTDNTNSISLGIAKQSTANSLSISRNVRALVKDLKQQLPAGMSLVILRDDSDFVEASAIEVLVSMGLAAIFVFVIVFVFIGSIKAALIPIITVPISIISACMVLSFLGYSINMLTLLAMVLAIGMVVDDAILVLENIQRYIDEGKHPLVASVCGSRQVIFAVISTTVVLFAVFMPIGVLPGKTGRLFIEFSVAISSAIFFSSVIALTLTPMLCSKLLSAHKDSRFNKFVDRNMYRLRQAYGKFLLRCFGREKILMGSFALLTIFTIFVAYRLPGEYEPDEDRNMFMIKMKAREGIGFQEMQKYLDLVLEKVMPLRQQNIATNILIGVPGFNGADGAVNSAAAMVTLCPQSDRDVSVFNIVKNLRGKLRDIPGIQALPVLPKGIGSKGSYPLQIVLGGYSYSELAHWRDKIFAAAADYPGIVDINCDYKDTTPKIRIKIDKERAGDVKISAEEIGSTLETMLGSKKVTTFTDRGQEYDVVLQADRSQRSNIRDISNIYVRSLDNQLIPLDNVITVVKKGEPAKLERYNRSRAITIAGNISSGYSMSDAVLFLEKTVREQLPEHAQIYYRGQTKDYKDSEGGMFFVFILAVLVSYLVLAAQFESFRSPFIIMLSVPLGVFGAVCMLMMFGFTMNIYSQIGLIMLIGLSAKNGILIVEFANQLRDEGMAFEKALVEASKLRLRPLLMTAISTVIGALPLILSVGAGAISRQNLGVVLVFGGVSGALLTLLIIPVGYLLINKNERSPHHVEKQLAGVGGDV